MRPDDARHGREAKPPPLEFSGEERIENAGLGGGVHAAAGVADFQKHAAFAFQARNSPVVIVIMPEPLPMASAALSDEVHQHLLHLAGVRLDRGKIGSEVEDRARSSSKSSSVSDFDALLHQRRQIHRLDDEAALAGVGEHLPRQVGGVLAAFDDTPEHVDHGAPGRQHVFGQAGVSDDAHQEIIEVMRDSARQKADTLHLLRLTELVFPDSDFFLGHFPIGNVELDAIPRCGAVRIAGRRRAQQRRSPVTRCYCDAPPSRIASSALEIRLSERPVDRVLQEGSISEQSRHRP